MIPSYPKAGRSAIDRLARRDAYDRSISTCAKFVDCHPTNIALTAPFTALVAPSDDPMKNPLRLLAALLAAPFLAGQPAANPTSAGVTEVPGLPCVLLLGDSISIGYTLPVRAVLQGRANVHRTADNCSWTGYGIIELDAWLGDSRWDVIHFNFGDFKTQRRTP
jgi:hypothetical protein